MIPLQAYIFSLIFKKFGKKVISITVFTAIFIYISQSFLYFHSGKLGNSDSIRINFIRTNFNPNLRIATWQSGVTGYYLENVYNLDGKVDPVALKFTNQYGIEKYLDLRKIDVLIEWKYWIDSIDQDYLEKN